MKLIKHFLAAAVLATSAFGTSAQFFNHLGVNVQAGTNGITVEGVTNITNFVNLRAGVDYMPDFNITTDADVTIDNPNLPDGSIYSTIDLNGSIKRTQGHVIFNVYPFPRSSFFIAAGAYFGGDKLIKINGHSDEIADAMKEHPEYMTNAGVVIGDVTVPFDSKGNVSGGLKVAKFRPYVGLGFGRALPKHRVNFGFELGVQIDCKPELYTDHGTLDTSAIEDDNTYQKIINNLKVYPVLSFKLQFRAI